MTADGLYYLPFWKTKKPEGYTGKQINEIVRNIDAISKYIHPIHRPANPADVLAGKVKHHHQKPKDQ